jgi:hypothetical protein
MSAAPGSAAPVQSAAARTVASSGSGFARGSNLKAFQVGLLNTCCITLHGIAPGLLRVYEKAR